MKEEIIQAAQEIKTVLEKYPGLAKHVLLVEKEDQGNCYSFIEGAPKDICRGMINVGINNRKYKEFLDICQEEVQEYSKRVAPLTEEEEVDLEIDTWIDLHKKESPE